MADPPRAIVMIVDDSATVRGQIKAAVASRYDCLEATDGDEALALLSKSLPDAIIADVEMSRVGGVVLLERLRERPECVQVPVIIVTTTTDIDQMNRCRALGCRGFVLKPVDPSYLLAKLGQIIRR